MTWVTKHEGSLAEAKLAKGPPRHAGDDRSSPKPCLESSVAQAFEKPPASQRRFMRSHSLRDARHSSHDRQGSARIPTNRRILACSPERMEK